jgi:replicative DNA helicase
MNHNLDAEKNVIAGCINSTDGYVRVAMIVDSKHFYEPIHKVIFQAIVNVYCDGKAVDMITVEDHLNRIGKLEEVGGITAIMNISSYTVGSANIEDHAKVVKEHAINRGLLQCAGQVQAKIDGGATSQEVISSLMNIASKAQDVSSGSKVYNMEQLVQLSKDSITASMNARESGNGLATGIPGVDRKIGGLKAGDLVMIAARPSTGKSDLAINISQKVIDKGHAVGFISAEMTPEVIMSRVWGLNLSIDRLKVKNADLDEFETEAIWKNKDIAQMPLYIDFTSSPNVHMIRARLTAMKANYGIKVAVIDHMHEMSFHTNHKNSNMNWREIPKGLRDVARDLEMPIVLVAQLSRETEHSNRKPKLSDIREAGEESADVVIMLWREHYQSDDSVKVDELELLIRKARNGVTGTVKCLYDLTTGFIGELNAPF